jgi:plastocyanin
MTSLKSRHRWQSIAAVAAIFGLLLVAIHSAAASTGPPATASRGASVSIANFAFHPPTLTIAKGSTVTFSNASRVTHTATRGGTFNTGLIRPGKSVSVRFKQKGSFAYHCLIHPEMHGKIVVR